MGKTKTTKPKDIQVQRPVIDDTDRRLALSKAIYKNKLKEKQEKIEEELYKKVKNLYCISNYRTKVL
jgi:hypothetical protein